MKAIEVDVKLKTTSECIELLNRYDLIPIKWKRTHKISFGELEVRTFKSEDEVKTIVTGGYQETRIFPNLDFADFVPLVKEISKIAKQYYTHDYGSVFINPYTKDLYISAGDGGYGYSTIPKAKLQKQMDKDGLCFDEMDKGFIDFNKHETLKELNSVEWEAESNPDDLEFIEICEINTLE